jgi:glc operon protein GlcG
MRQIPSIDCSSALKIVQAIQAEIERRSRAASIAVVDSYGEAIVCVRMDGAKLPTSLIALNKAVTAAREEKSTMEIGEMLRAKNLDIAFFGDPRFCGFGGGVPVIVDGRTIGAVAVSGFTQAEDDQLARFGIEAGLRV